MILDETTERATTTQLAILAIYFDIDEYKMKQVLLDLKNIPDGKSQTIYNALAQCLRDRHIPFKNMVGFCADTCNVMFGSKQSLSQLIAQNHPWVVQVKCSCHTIHLCASHAASELPKSVEDLCRNVFAHFSQCRQKDKDTWRNSRSTSNLKSTGSFDRV